MIGHFLVAPTQTISINPKFMKFARNVVLMQIIENKVIILKYMDDETSLLTKKISIIFTGATMG